MLMACSGGRGVGGCAAGARCPRGNLLERDGPEGLAREEEDGDLSLPQVQGQILIVILTAVGKRFYHSFDVADDRELGQLHFVVQALFAALDSNYVVFEGGFGGINELAGKRKGGADRVDKPARGAQAGQWGGGDNSLVRRG